MNFCQKRLALFVLSLLPFALPAQPYRWYVRATGASGNELGTNWADAFSDLRQALDFANAGDEIWVASGIYRPTADGDRDKSFLLRSGVKFYGGFAGTETSPTERSISANPTILSGDIGQPGDSTDNSRTILYLDRPDSTTLISGLVFEKGQATNTMTLLSTDPSICGAGIYMNVSGGSASPIVEDCVFRNNYAQQDGGGFYINDKAVGSSLPAFARCRFASNHSGVTGAAVLIRGGKTGDHSIEFDSCQFDRNWAEVGGSAIEYVKESGDENLQIRNCRFLENRSADYGTILGYDFLGGLGGSEVEITGCEAVGNHNGAGAQINLKNFSAKKLKRLRVENCVFHQNRSDDNYFPSILSAEAGEVLILGNWFSENICGEHLISFFGATKLKAQGNSFLSNKKPLFAPPGYFDALIEVVANDMADISENLFRGNELTLVTSTKARIYNNLMVGNSTNRSLFSFYGNFQGSPTTVAFHNNLLFGNRAAYSGVAYSQGTIVTASNNTFSKNLDNLGQPTLPMDISSNDDFLFELHFNHNLTDVGCPVGNPNFDCGTKNLLVADPQFAAPDSLDFHLSACSPALDAGDKLPWMGFQNPFDFDGKPRFPDGKVDIGPFERSSLAVPIIEKIQPACDSLTGGKVIFSIPDGCPPFQFFWQNGISSSGTDTAHLAAGGYHFTIVDSRGNGTIADVQIPGFNLSATIAGDSLFCENEPGAQLEAAVAGGFGQVFYEWNTGETSLILQNAGEGSHLFTATDAAGCTAIDSIFVEMPAATIAQFTVNGATGPAAADGSIVLNLISGLPPFNFSWSNGDSTGNPGSLAPGPYSITITNAAGCMAVVGLTVGFTIGTGGVGANEARFYPNPAGSRLFVEWGGFDGLEFFDQLGRRVFFQKREGGAASFALDGLAPGVYRAVFSENGKPARPRPLAVRF